MTVTLTVSVTDSSGNETVTTHDFATGGTTPLVGDVSGTFGDCFVAGDLNLTGDLFIEGLMTGIDTLTVEGNGFSVFFQNGGRPDLHGKLKARWGPWGTDSTGWAVGDRVAVAPTAVGIFVPSELLWVGGWASMPRPSNSPDVTLVDGTIAKPEVVNLSQSIVFKNLSRGFHLHDSAGVASLSDVKFLNCGTSGVLGSYPVHFHVLGDNSRGSLLERVVVEGGKNHAYVPHGSHGIDFIDCAAYNVTNFAYWWDPTNDLPANDSDDIRYLHCLALKVNQEAGNSRNRLAAFHLGHGSGNACVDSVAVGVAIADSTSGFHWPEGADADWIFTDCVAHNNRTDGIFTWQNSPNPNHVVGPYVSYHNGRYGVEHGAYTNRYRYADLILNEPLSFGLHSLGQFQVIENVAAAGNLVILKHNVANTTLGATIRNCQFARVVYKETSNSGTNASRIVYEDCGLAPADFDLTGIVAGSIIEVREAGVLTHRWAGGWT